MDKRKRTDKHELPTFPDLFWTIGDFLRNAKVPSRQMPAKKAACKAFQNAAYLLFYSDEAEADAEGKVYPCTKTPRVPLMSVDLAGYCPGKRGLVPLAFASRARKVRGVSKIY